MTEIVLAIGGIILIGLFLGIRICSKALQRRRNVERGRDATEEERGKTRC